MGAVAGPFDAWLVLRGLKTLGVRMDRHCDNAEQVVEFLNRHEAVSHVYYPGLPEHPGHDVAARQMKRFGGIGRSRSPAASSMPSTCAAAPRCSPSASRSAASRA